VKAVVQFRGREIAHVDIGKKLLLRFAADLASVGTVEGQPRLEGRNAHVLLSPMKAATAPHTPTTPPKASSPAAAHAPNTPAPPTPKA
jgi:translation initiation factor IF-3